MNPCESCLTIHEISIINAGSIAGSGAGGRKGEGGEREEREGREGGRE